MGFGLRAHALRPGCILGAGWYGMFYFIHGVCTERLVVQTVRLSLHIYIYICIYMSSGRTLQVSEFMLCESDEASGRCVGESYLEGQGDLVSWLIAPITHTITRVILIISRLTKSPWPSKYRLKPPQHLSLAAVWRHCARCEKALFSFLSGNSSVHFHLWWIRLAT